MRGVAVARAEADLAGLRAGAVERAAGVRALGVRGAFFAADRAALGPPQAGLAVAAGAVALVAAVLAVPVAVDAGARRGGGAPALELGQLVVLAVARGGDEERACQTQNSGMRARTLTERRSLRPDGSDEKEPGSNCCCVGWLRLCSPWPRATPTTEAKTAPRILCVCKNCPPMIAKQQTGRKKLEQDSSKMKSAF